MRRIMLMLSLTAVLVVSAVPVASAQDRDDRRENRLENRLDRFDDGFFFNVDRFDDDRFFFDDDFDRFDRFDRFFFDDGFGEFDQDAESGDVDQSFDVSSTGDNSNQCVDIQGVANTGNAQNQTSVLQIGSDADDFEFDDNGADIDVSGSSEVTCDQQVNQAASAFGR